jgi:uncharacterized protein (TIGR00369 family)
MTERPDIDIEASEALAHRIRTSFGRQGLMTLLGAEIIEIAPGRVVIGLARRPEVSQQHGYVHAGAVSAIADSAGGYAGLTMMSGSSDVLTVEYKLNLLAPAIGDTLEAVGTVVKSGRTLSVCRLEVFAIDSSHRKLVAVGQQTLIQLPARTDE